MAHVTIAFDIATSFRLTCCRSAILSAPSGTRLRFGPRTREHMHVVSRSGVAFSGLRHGCYPWTGACCAVPIRVVAIVYVAMYAVLKVDRRSPCVRLRRGEVWLGAARHGQARLG